MSLLLDALKKAERDKQKAREAEIATVDSEQLEQKTVSGSSHEQNKSDQPPKFHKEAPQVEEMAGELELVSDEPPAELVFVEETAQEETKVEETESSQTPSIETEKSTATNSTVSDEALQLLVYKTNKRYHQRQKMIWGSLLSAATFILLSAGAYYYYGVLEEVETLDRKYKLAMQIVHAEPVVQQQTAAAIESTASMTKIQSSQNKTGSVQVVTEKPKANKAKPAAGMTEVQQDFSVQQTTKKDPINILLQDAWRAYNKADYAASSQGYENVLKREPRNRDALLGMAAIAVKEADYKKAKASYSLLLKLDPRDQVAMAAMSNINELSSGTQDETKLKFMLQQQPTATHLNFALGNYYAKKSQWPQAQAEYFKAWQGNSKNADYVYNLAVSLDQLGKKNEALRFYKECLLLGNGQNISFSADAVEKRIEAISVK